MMTVDPNRSGQEAAGRPSIFRQVAVDRLMQGRDRAVLPRFATRRTVVALWLALGLLAAVGVAIGRTRVPIRIFDPNLLVEGGEGAATAGWAIVALAGLAGVLYGARSLVRRRTTPVVLQLSASECGAACLAMILGHFGRPTRVAECRDRCGVGRDGLTALAIVQAARSFGLRARAFSLEPDAFRHVPLPAIVHWEFDHFLVVERWSPQRVRVIDPASGRRELTAAEFDAGFTGVVIACEPGAHFVRRVAHQAVSWRSYLVAFARTAPGVLLQILAASLLIQLFGLALPATTKVVVDEVLPSGTDELLPILAFGLVIIVLSGVLTGFLRSTLLLALRARVDSRMMLGFFEHLLALPLRYFEQRTSGDLLMRLSSNTIIREMLTSQTLSLILDGSLILGYLAILFARDAAFGGIVLAIAAAQFLFLAATRGRMHDLTQRDLAAQSTSQSYLVEALSGVATLKASGSEDAALGHWSNLFTEQLNVSLRRGGLSAIQTSTLSGLHTVAPLALLWVGAYRVLDGSMSLGTMLALQALAAAALAPLSSLIASAQIFQTIGAQLERLGDVLEAEPEQDRQAVQPAPELRGRVELERVGFRYDPHAPEVLRDVSLTIEPGQKVALVGATGSGKSTLAKLLLGLYAASEGEIRYDGASLAGIELQSLRRQFGVVLQEPFLFSGSIRDNIAFNDPALPLERVIEAATLAGVHHEIASLPMGYETRLSEGGGGLSGGQRQRIALARALAHRPALLVLDEATSHLDAATEALVDANLSGLACTRIVIAHRLSTIRNADQILVLDRGEIVERGTHDELMAWDGRYAELIRHQASGAAPASPVPEQDRMLVVTAGLGGIG
jgi:HlyB family type I secretion system ABC transporter